MLVLKFLQNLKGSSTSEDIAGPGDIIDSIASQHGILVERASGIYSFSHLTFLEYFMAQYAVNAGTDYQVELINSCIAIDQWREVIILLCCLVNDADQLLIALMEAAVTKGFAGGPLEELRTKQRARSKATQSKFVLNPPDSDYEVRAALSVVGKADGPSIDQVQKASKLLSNSLLPEARRAIRLIATNAAFGFLFDFEQKESYRDMNIRYIQKKKFNEIAKGIELNGPVKDPEAAISKMVVYKFWRSRLSEIRFGLDLIADVIPDGQVFKEVKGRMVGLRSHPVWGAQPAPENLFDVRLAVVGAITNLFKQNLRSRAFGLKNDFFLKLEQQLLEAIDLNSLPEIQTGMQRLYIFDLIHDVLKQPIVARPEVRSAVMRTLLEKDYPDPGPYTDEMRMRA
jgi:hypothetical protein